MTASYGRTTKSKEKVHKDEILCICFVEDDFWQDEQSSGPGYIKAQNKIVCDKEEGDTTACGYRCHNKSHVYPDQDNKVLNPWRAPFSRAGESDLLQTCRSHNIVPWRAPFSRAGESDLLQTCRSHNIVPWRAPFSRAGESDLLLTCRSHNIVPWRAPFSRAGENKKEVDRMSDTHECFSVCFNHGDNSGFIQLVRAASLFTLSHGVFERIARRRMERTKLCHHTRPSRHQFNCEMHSRCTKDCRQ